MKILLNAAAVIALMAGAAHAQPQPDDRGRDTRPASRPAPRPTRPAPATRGASPSRPASPAPGRAYAPAPSGRTGQYAPQAPRPGYRGQGAPQTPYRGAAGGYRSDRRDGGARGGWSGQRSYQAQRRFQDGGYRYPRGWYARRWAYGEYLPQAWFGQDYWLDFGTYDLAPPPYGAEWVRVGNDALLIDISSGQVLSVEYGLFD